MKGDFSRTTFDPSKHYSAVLMQQGRVQLDADWNEQQAITRHRIATEAADVIGTSGAPLHAAGFAISIKDEQLVIGAGRYYVDGLVCEQATTRAYAAQPDLPDPPTLAELLKAPSTAAIVYLHVFERHETWLDDPAIREVALGGADTTSRLRTVWQVKLLPVQAPAGPLDSSEHFDEWDALIAPPDGLLTVRTNSAGAGADSPCLVPPQAGYRRLENQLYRVEIHQGGDLDAATFKWSRDNGSVVAAITQPIDGHRVTVRDLGMDDLLGFANGQLVEIIDDHSELNGLPGQLVRITGIDSATRTLTLEQAPAQVNLNSHPKLRRWDGFAPVKAAAGEWIRAEDTIELRFSNGSYASGDYWTFPARTATSTIEWPFGPTGYLPQAPHGIPHHYAPLALVWRDAAADGNPLRVVDWRRFFAPLAEPPEALHITQIGWDNDALLQLDQFKANGLTIQLDSPPDPVTINSSSVIVTLEANVSITQLPIPIKLSAILDGTIKMLDPQRFQWLPTAPALQAVAAASASTPALRLRVLLKGHTIWGAGQSLPGLAPATRYLDGQAFGASVLEGQRPRIGLSLPSGAGLRASDFESWLYLTPPPSVPLHAMSVRFVAAAGRPESETNVAAIKLPLLRGAPIRFAESAKVNRLFIAFSQRIRATVPNTAFSIVRLPEGRAVQIEINKSIQGVQLDLVPTGVQQTTAFGDGSYQLKIAKNAVQGEDGSALEDDIVIPFQVTPLTRQATGKGKTPISFD